MAGVGGVGKVGCRSELVWKAVNGHRRTFRDDYARSGRDRYGNANLKKSEFKNGDLAASRLAK